MSQTEDGLGICISEGIPFDRRKIEAARAIESSLFYHLARIVSSAEKYNKIGSSARAEIKYSCYRCHCGVGAEILFVMIAEIGNRGACPAVVDSELCFEGIDKLHPPGFIYIRYDTIGSSCTITRVIYS